jgi:hypothetical protein
MSLIELIVFILSAAALVLGASGLARLLRVPPAFALLILSAFVAILAYRADKTRGRAPLKVLSAVALAALVSIGIARGSSWRDAILVTPVGAGIVLLAIYLGSLVRRR